MHSATGPSRKDAFWEGWGAPCGASSALCGPTSRAPYKHETVANGVRGADCHPRVARVRTGRGSLSGCKRPRRVAGVYTNRLQGPLDAALRTFVYTIVSRRDESLACERAMQRPIAGLRPTSSARMRGRLMVASPQPGSYRLAAPRRNNATVDAAMAIIGTGHFHPANAALERRTCMTRGNVTRLQTVELSGRIAPSMRASPYAGAPCISRPIPAWRRARA